MTIDLKELVPDWIRSLAPYPPGKPIEELEREYGIFDSIKHTALIHSRNVETITRMIPASRKGWRARQRSTAVQFGFAMTG